MAGDLPAFTLLSYSERKAFQRKCRQAFHEAAARSGADVASAQYVGSGMEGLAELYVTEIEPKRSGLSGVPFDADFARFEQKHHFLQNIITELQNEGDLRFERLTRYWPDPANTFAAPDLYQLTDPPSTTKELDLSSFDADEVVNSAAYFLVPPGMKPGGPKPMELSSDSDETSIAQRDPHDNDMGGFDQGFAQPPAVVSPPRAAAAPAKSFDMDIDEGLTADTEDGGDEARDLGIGTSKSGGARKARKPRKSFFDDQVVTGAPKRKGKEKARERDLEPIQGIEEDTIDENCILTLGATKSKKRKMRKQRLFRARTAYNPAKAPPKPPNPFDEERLADLWPSSKKNKRPLYRLHDFVVLGAAKLAKGDLETASLLHLLVDKRKKAVVVVGLASPFHKDDSDAEDSPTLREEAAEVHLWGKYDIRRLDFTASGLVLHTRLGQYILESWSTTPSLPRALRKSHRRAVGPDGRKGFTGPESRSLVGRVSFDETLLQRVRRLLNVFTYARSRSIRGNYVEEGDEREEVEAEKVAKQIRYELVRLQETPREARDMAWQRSLPFEWRVSVEDLQLQETEEVLLFRKLLDIPFIAPDVYKLIAAFFFPNAFRTHDFEAVRESMAREKKFETRLLERCRRIVHQDLDDDPEELAEPMGDYVVAKHPLTGRKVEVYKQAIVNGRTFQVGDVVLIRPDSHPPNRDLHRDRPDVDDFEEFDAESPPSSTDDDSDGSNDVALWFGMVVHFHRSPSKNASKPSELLVHIHWFATASTVRSLGEYLSQRHLLSLDKCDDFPAVAILEKVDFQFVKPAAASRTSFSMCPTDGFFSWAQYNEEDGSFKDIPPTVFAIFGPPLHDRKTDVRALFPECLKAGVSLCPSCETTLDSHYRTREPKEDEGSRRRALRAIRIDGGFEIDGVPYHVGDYVFVVPAEDPSDGEDEEEPDGGDRAAGADHPRPYRLARIVSIIAAADEPDEVDEVEVEWLPRASDIDKRLRPTGHFLSEREVFLTDAPACRLATAHISGKFSLSELCTPDDDDATREIALLEDSSSNAFYARFRLVRKPGDPAVDRGFGEDGDVWPIVDANGFFYPYSFEAVRLEQGALTTCGVCKAQRDREVAERQEVRSYASQAELNHLALYAGGGLLDLGLEQGCSVLSVKHAVEKHAPAASCMRSNALHPLKTLETTVSNVSEAMFYGLDEEDAEIPPVGRVYSVAGGAPCQGFSQANHYKRTDDLRSLEPFVFLSTLAISRPLVAVFENVAAFKRHALPVQGSRSGSYFQLFVAVCVALGYQVRWTVVDAAGFGVPQHRRRLILQLTASGFPLPDAPHPTHAVSNSVMHFNQSLTESDPQEPWSVFAPHKAVTIADTIDDLPPFKTIVPETEYVPRTYGVAWGDSKSPRTYDSPPRTSIQLRLRTTISPDGKSVTLMREPTHHVCRSVNKVVATRLITLKHVKADGTGGNHEDLAGKACYPEPPEWVIKNPKKFYVWWRRLRRDSILSPLRTTQNLDGASHGERIHYKQPRALSLRELLRVQGCPDISELNFSHATGDESFEEALRVIGNGVPVPLAAALGRALEDKLRPIVLDWLRIGAEGDLWHSKWLECGGERLRSTAGVVKIGGSQAKREAGKVANSLAKATGAMMIADDEWMDVQRGDDDDLYATPAPEPVPSTPKARSNDHAPRADLARKSAAHPSPARNVQRTPTSQSTASSSSGASGQHFRRGGTDDTRLTSVETGPSAQGRLAKRTRTQSRDAERDEPRAGKEKAPQVMDIDSEDAEDEVVVVSDTEGESSEEEKGPTTVITIEDSSDEDF